MNELKPLRISAEIQDLLSSELLKQTYRFALILSQSITDDSLRDLVASGTIARVVFNDYLEAPRLISVAYADASGAFVAVGEIAPDADISGYAYGVALLDERGEMLAIRPLEPTALSGGVGAKITFKIGVNGAKGDIYFTRDDGAGLKALADSITATRLEFKDRANALEREQESQGAAIFELVGEVSDIEERLAQTAAELEATKQTASAAAAQAAAQSRQIAALEQQTKTIIASANADKSELAGKLAEHIAQNAAEHSQMSAAIAVNTHKADTAQAHADAAQVAADAAQLAASKVASELDATNLRITAQAESITNYIEITSTARNDINALNARIDGALDAILNLNITDKNTEISLTELTQKVITEAAKSYETARTVAEIVAKLNGVDFVEQSKANDKFASDITLLQAATAQLQTTAALHIEKITALGNALKEMQLADTERDSEIARAHERIDAHLLDFAALIERLNTTDAALAQLRTEHEHLAAKAAMAADLAVTDQIAKNAAAAVIAAQTSADNAQFAAEQAMAAAQGAQTSADAADAHAQAAQTAAEQGIADAAAADTKATNAQLAADAAQSRADAAMLAAGVADDKAAAAQTAAEAAQTTADSATVLAKTAQTAADRAQSAADAAQLAADGAQAAADANAEAISLNTADIRKNAADIAELKARPSGGGNNGPVVVVGSDASESTPLGSISAQQEAHWQEHLSHIFHLLQSPSPLGKKRVIPTSKPTFDRQYCVFIQNIHTGQVHWAKDEYSSNAQFLQAPHESDGPIEYMINIAFKRHTEPHQDIDALCADAIIGTDISLEDAKRLDAWQYISRQMNLILIYWQPKGITYTTGTASPTTGDNYVVAQAERAPNGLMPRPRVIAAIHPDWDATKRKYAARVYGTAWHNERHHPLMVNKGICGLGFRNKLSDNVEALVFGLSSGAHETSSALYTKVSNVAAGVQSDDEALHAAAQALGFIDVPGGVSFTAATEVATMGTTREPPAGVRIIPLEQCGANLANAYILQVPMSVFRGTPRWQQERAQLFMRQDLGAGRSALPKAPTALNAQNGGWWSGWGDRGGPIEYHAANYNASTGAGLSYAPFASAEIKIVDKTDGTVTTIGWCYTSDLMEGIQPFAKAAIPYDARFEQASVRFEHAAAMCGYYGYNNPLAAMLAKYASVLNGDEDA